MALPEDELACVVLSLGADPAAIDAIRSLRSQSNTPELVLVNSGGGDLAGMLQAAELEVPVVNRSERLLPGAARNDGIAATRAPYVAFLAADCQAEPGWVEGRLRAHRAGASAVASAMSGARASSLPARAAHLFLHHRRLPDTPEGLRLLYGLSYERSLFARFGSFREDLRTGEDTEFNSRLSGQVSIAFAADVRTSHRHPERLGEMLRDLHSRGRRRAQEAGLEGKTRRQIARGSARNVLHAVRDLRHVADATERRRLLAAVPLLVPAAAAYAAGVLSSESGDGSAPATQPQPGSAVARR